MTLSLATAFGTKMRPSCLIIPGFEAGALSRLFRRYPVRHGTSGRFGETFHKSIAGQRPSKSVMVGGPAKSISSLEMKDQNRPNQALQLTPPVPRSHFLMISLHSFK